MTRPLEHHDAIREDLLALPLWKPWPIASYAKIMEDLRYLWALCRPEDLIE